MTLSCRDLLRRRRGDRMPSGRELAGLTTERHRTPAAGRRVPSADLATKIQEGAIECRVGSVRAGNPMKVESQLESAVVVMVGDPHRNPGGGAIDKHLATVERERQHRPTHVVAYSRQRSKLHLVVWHPPV